MGHTQYSILQMNMTSKLLLGPNNCLIVNIIITWYDCPVGLHILHGKLEYLLVLIDGAERRLGGQGRIVPPGGGHCHEQCHELITGCHAALQQGLGANKPGLNSDLGAGLSSAQDRDCPLSRDAQNKKHSGRVETVNNRVLRLYVAILVLLLIFLIK